MTNEMWGHEDRLKEYREGFRGGLEYSIDLLKILQNDIAQDGRVSESLWVSLVVEILEDELSMYVVGDEE